MSRIDHRPAVVPSPDPTRRDDQDERTPPVTPVATTRAGLPPIANGRRTPQALPAARPGDAPSEPQALRAELLGSRASLPRFRPVPPEGRRLVRSGAVILQPQRTDAQLEVCWDALPRETRDGIVSAIHAESDDLSTIAERFQCGEDLIGYARHHQCAAEPVPGTPPAAGTSGTPSA